MAAIDNLMKKLGFVKISQYGLVLTPEGRLLSMRPAVLDDGFGGRIVGWQDGDLAAAELEKWEPARPASPQAVANRVAAARPPVPTRPLPGVRAPAPPVPTTASPASPASAAPVAAIVREHVVPIVAIAAPVPVPVRVPVPLPVAAARPALNVAPAPVVEEDDWEWTIAIARARAAAEEVEDSVVAAQAPQRRMRADTVPPPVIAAKPDPIATDSWPKTEPLGEIDYNDYTSPVAEVVRVVRLAQPPTPVAASTSVRVAPPTPSTVIPIPRLPNTANASPRSSSMTPVVRPTLPTPILPTPPRRFAKGTAPVLPQSTSSIKPPVSPPAPAVSEDTVPNFALPPAAAAVALPSTKRLTRG